MGFKSLNEGHSAPTRDDQNWNYMWVLGFYVELGLVMLSLKIKGTFGTL